mgnify:CR=1 FL=1
MHNRVMLRRWIFADQLGPHFLDGDDDVLEAIVYDPASGSFESYQPPLGYGPRFILRVAAIRDAFLIDAGKAIVKIPGMACGK